LPNSVQIAAAQGRDDLVFRAARVLEKAVPVAVVDLG
jgi:Asp-tRNA(Asn)/Glu-tRNA(Gln) amidotransferase A subunit family amidase